MDWIRIRWEKGTCYYEVYLHQDLWGEWVLTGTGLGTVGNTVRQGHYPEI